MILPNFILESRVNQTWDFSGMDDPKVVKDKNHFKNYPYPVTYNYNSRGFRDTEWPDNLTNAVWCFGDSFTAGVGVPIDHIWPSILESRLNRKCINISMDGASNNWISRKAVEVLTEIKPDTIVIHWSFIWRSESLDQRLTDEKRRIHYTDEDFSGMFRRFLHCVKLVEEAKQKTTVIHSVIPGFTFYTPDNLIDLWNAIKGADWPKDPITSFSDFEQLESFVKEEILQMSVLTVDDFLLYDTELNGFYKTQKWVKPFNVLDVARDKFHYDKLTANKFVDQILELI